MPILHILTSIFFLFLLVAWFWVVISVITDIFRSEDLSGFSKALWVLFVIVIPWLGLLAYLILRGDGMAQRNAELAKAVDDAQRAYIRDAAGGISVADELAKLGDLRDKGVITDDEFAAQKAKLLG